ncbi:PREDICTED: C-type lectin 37Da-like [Nicrophorus vespilloides]|uniref:C-type lectin 37Da-like n=1 Tax=Nicrophorus vespilloides TaxID=110193 RepID=A0ABM1NAV6_NICVS|nr:PREDICTED: C-type lectin 37Da-like [Nicrophorus vespilloides]
MSRICVVLVLFIVCTQALSLAESRHKRQVTNQFRNKNYYVESLIKANFYNAFLFCQRLGMRLLTIDNNEEYDYILNILRTQIQFKPGSKLWTSGTDLAQEGTFHWMSTGFPVLINKWLPKQPDNGSGNENCICFWNNRGTIGFNDEQCTDVANFICESPKL